MGPQASLQVLRHISECQHAYKRASPPFATELVCAVVAKHELVGISHECNFPVDLGDRPALTSTRLGPRLVESAELLAACIHSEVFDGPAELSPGEAIKIELNAK